VHDISRGGKDGRGPSASTRGSLAYLVSDQVLGPAQAGVRAKYAAHPQEEGERRTRRRRSFGLGVAQMRTARLPPAAAERRHCRRADSVQAGGGGADGGGMAWERVRVCTDEEDKGRSHFGANSKFRVFKREAMAASRRDVGDAEEGLGEAEPVEVAHAAADQLEDRGGGEHGGDDVPPDDEMGDATKQNKTTTMGRILQCFPRKGADAGVEEVAAADGTELAGGATDLSTVQEASNEHGVDDADEDMNEAARKRRPAGSSFASDVLAHPLAKLMLGTLALLFLFIVCGGGAASVQPWLARAAPSSSAYFSAGTVSIGVISCGSTLSGGMFSIGMISIGTFSVGIFSVGLFSIGFFSIGLASVGHYALGMWAWGIIVAYSKDGQGLESARRMRLPFGLTDDEAPETWLTPGDDLEAGEARRQGGKAVVVSNAAAPARVDPTAAGKRVIEVRDPRKSSSSAAGKPDAYRAAKAPPVGGLGGGSCLLPNEILLGEKDGSSERLEAVRAALGDEAATLLTQLCRVCVVTQASIGGDMSPQGTGPAGPKPLT